MAVEITGTYTGNLNVELEHGPSGVKIQTAAPLDNKGDGSSFSPTDLMAAALGACMTTIMGIVAERNGIDLRGMTFRVEKHMNADPRRIGQVPVELHMPAGLDANQRKKLERAALTCPVHHSYHPDIDKPVKFFYPD